MANIKQILKKEMECFKRQLRLRRTHRSMKCGCIVDYKKNGKWMSRQCRNKAYIQLTVHPENEHTLIGTGYRYWVPVCPKHLTESKTLLFVERKGIDWKNYHENHR